jgi:hypothetical protein
VRGIPYDKRSPETATYVGSLMGASMEVDRGTLDRTDYVRVKIVVKDETKIPVVAEVAIIPFLYDFHYEREVVSDNNPTLLPILVSVDKGQESPVAKRSKTDGVGHQAAQNFD